MLFHTVMVGSRCGLWPKARSAWQSLSSTRILGLCMQKQECDEHDVCTEKKKTSPAYKGNSHGHHSEMEHIVRVECTVWGQAVRWPAASGKTVYSLSPYLFSFMCSCFFLCHKHFLCYKHLLVCKALGNISIFLLVMYPWCSKPWG